MKIFSCPNCNSQLFFSNLECSCGIGVVFDAERQIFRTADDPCANRKKIGCNWSSGSNSAELCPSCRMTKIIPDTFHDDNRDLWSTTESAKRWTLATLGRWGWFVKDDKGRHPVFHLLSEATKSGETPVSMGHLDGVITINVSEADPVDGIEKRLAFGERYRTMLGHFRHELAHFVFERLGVDAEFLAEFRTLFGNETGDYALALSDYYENGPPEGWNRSHVTAYASSHPHEDWAESFAHLLHLTDISDSFAAAGLDSSGLIASGFDAYSESDADRLISIGADLGIALNHVNRSMGLPDLYPFVLSPTIRKKLAFVHRWVRRPPADPS